MPQHKKQTTELDQVVAITKALLLNYDVEKAAIAAGISYRTACRRLQKYGLTNRGLPKPRQATELTKKVWEQIVAKFETATELCNTLNLPPTSLKNITRTLKLRPDWALEHHLNQSTARGRTAELLAKNTIFKGDIKKDSLIAKKTGSRTAPYDLIVRGIGAIDVKSTLLKDDDVFKFTTRHSKQTKALVLVGFDANGEQPIFAWLVTREEADGAQSIRIPHPKTKREHKGTLIWVKGITTAARALSEKDALLIEEVNSGIIPDNI